MKTKSDKTVNKSMTLLDHCHRYGVSLQIANIVKMLFTIPSDKFGAWHFYACVRVSSVF